MADVTGQQLMTKFHMKTPEGAIELNKLLNKVRKAPQKRAIEVLNQGMSEISVYHPEVYDQAVKDAITRELGSQYNIKWDLEDLDGPGEYGFGGDWWKK